MFSPGRALVISILVMVVVFPSLAFAQPAQPARPAAQSAFEKEWAEVVKKYPHVAHAYLSNLEALDEGVQFALLVDPKAFKLSAFYARLLDLCLQRQGDHFLLVRCSEVVEPPSFTKNCRPCRGACATPETVVDCSNCRQRNADNGCRP